MQVIIAKCQDRSWLKIGYFFASAYLFVLNRCEKLFTSKEGERTTLLLLPHGTQDQLQLSGSRCCYLLSPLPDPQLEVFKTVCCIHENFF